MFGVVQRITLVFVCIMSLTTLAFGEVIKIGAGAGAPTENILKPLKGPFEKATGIQLDIISAGATFALQNVESGMIDAGAAGLSFQDWLVFMKKEGTEVKNPSLFNSFVIGKDTIRVIVNKENSVTKLSKEQLQKIFSGEIENWKDVGGADSPIMIAWGKLQSGTNSTFIKHIMDGKPVARDLLDVLSANDVRDAVASNPAAIGFGPGGVVNDSIKVTETPEISRDITLATKGKPSARVQKLIDFIQGEGKKYIRQ